MPYDLAWWPQADEAYARLENDPGRSEVLRAVNRVLDRLEVDPSDPRLGSTIFQSPEYRGVAATQVGTGDWTVFWRYGAEGGIVEIVLIHELPLGARDV